VIPGQELIRTNARRDFSPFQGSRAACRYQHCKSAVINANTANAINGLDVDPLTALILSQKKNKNFQPLQAQKGPLDTSEYCREPFLKNL